MKTNENLITVQITHEEKKWLDNMVIIKRSMEAFIETNQEIYNNYDRMMEKYDKDGKIDHKQYQKELRTIMTNYQDKLVTI